MGKMLKYLVLAGLIIWGLLLLDKYQPDISFWDYFSDANTSERCDKYAQDIEGDRVLDYGDRVKQFFEGCW